MSALRVRNWHKFQHFKDRRPPWVKLYRDLLDDRHFHALDGDSAKALIMLWLLAAEDPDQDGALPDLETIAFRLRITEHKANQILTKLSDWLIQDDITLISTRYQLDAPETETETETRAKPRAVATLPEWMPIESWAAWVAHRKEIRKPLTPSQSAAQIRKLATHRDDGHSPESVIEHSIAGGWQGLFPPDHKHRTNGHAHAGPIPPGTGTGPRGTRVIADIVRDADADADAAAALAAGADGAPGHGAVVAPDGRNLRPAALAGSRSRGSD